MKSWHWAALLAANALAWCVLGFHQASAAAPEAGNLPFANAVEQRQQIIKELQEIQALLREQNALLRGEGGGAPKPPRATR